MSNLNVGKKYDFQNSFDANERGMVAARDFTLADMERARAESFAEGKAASAAEARATIEHATAAALGIIGSRLGELGRDMDILKNDLENQALEAVLAIAGKLAPHYAKTHGTAEIEGVVRDCLSAVYDEPRVVIRAQEAVLDHIKAHLDGLIASSGFGGKVVLFADPSLGESDCRVEWADGGTERNTARLWQEIETNIARFLGRNSESGEETPPSAETDSM